MGGQNCSSQKASSEGPGPIGMLFEPKEVSFPADNGHKSSLNYVMPLPLCTGPIPMILLQHLHIGQTGIDRSWYCNRVVNLETKIQTSLLVFHECTKHIQIDGHFIRQHVQCDTTHLPPCNLGISSPRSTLLLGMAHIMNLRELWNAVLPCVSYSTFKFRVFGSSLLSVILSILLLWTNLVIRTFRDFQSTINAFLFLSTLLTEINWTGNSKHLNCIELLNQSYIYHSEIPHTCYSTLNCVLE